MASHIETGAMHAPINYTSQNLDHLGLVAGLYDELEIGKCLDTLITQDFKQRDVSIGQAVKAMVINGLGFTQRTLYLMPKFFQDKPVERLIGTGITAEKLNDTTLGRALDRLYETGITELYASLSAQAVKKLGLTCKTGHIDSTSFHVDGEYNRQEDSESGVIQIKKGYSRDHRPDLNQLGFQMITDNQAGIPIWMEALSGNSVDKTSFNDTVNNHIGQLKNSVGLEYLIADSALYVAKTLQDLADFLWISRVPETLKSAREMIASIAPDLLKTPEVASFRSLGMEYAGIKQHWLVIYTPQAHSRAIKSVNKQCLKQTTQQEKAFQTLCRQHFACQEEAQKALDSFSQKHPLIEISNQQLIAIPHYDTSGRPKKGQKPSSFTYKIEGNLFVLLAERQRRIERKSCYILATNQLDTDQLTAEDMMNKYKDQQKVERGFRFLKDPLFMASTLFLKSPKRIMALTMIMTLSLLIYAALEYRIREALKQSGNQFPNQRGEKISNPTVRWIFQFFAGIHVLLMNEVQTIVLNMNNHHLLILHLLGKEYEKLYSGYS